MPRKAREYSISNVYHIIFRGNDKQDIFFDNQDRQVFLNQLKETKEKYKYQIFSYCLMDNHIHMVIRMSKSNLCKAMQSLEIRYAMYFNKKMNRRGYLFENRYLSKKIENLQYFLNICKYIHRNPENAYMERTEKYKWSSFQEYLKGKDKIIDSKFLMCYYNNIDEFIKFTLTNDKTKAIDNYAELELINKLDEGELIQIIKEKFNLDNASDISLMKKEKKERAIKKLKNVKGTNCSQIARVTKVSRYLIKKVWEKDE